VYESQEKNSISVQLDEKNESGLMNIYQILGSFKGGC